MQRSACHNYIQHGTWLLNRSRTPGVKINIFVHAVKIKTSARRPTVKNKISVRCFAVKIRVSARTAKPKISRSNMFCGENQNISAYGSVRNSGLLSKTQFITGQSNLLAGQPDLTLCLRSQSLERVSVNISARTAGRTVKTNFTVTCHAVKIQISAHTANPKFHSHVIR